MVWPNKITNRNNPHVAVFLAVCLSVLFCFQQHLIAQTAEPGGIAEPDAATGSGIVSAADNIPSVEDEHVGSGVPLSSGAAADKLAESASQKSPYSNLAIKAEAADPYAKNVETTLFDVYLGDKLKGSVLADYTDDWLEISEPQEVIDQLKDLKEGKGLLPLLTGKIYKRKELPGLGAVHFNLNTFSIIIDADPQFLGASSLNLRRRAEDPEKAVSVQQRLGVVATGSTDDQSRNAFSHRSVVSYGSYYGLADGAVVSDRPYELNQAVIGGIAGNYRVGGGLLQTAGNNFASTLQYSGVKVETAEDLFLDQDLIRGSRFEVFIPSRSKVEFYRDGRLLSVQTLDFGLREIDTSSFPQGSYDVDIVINDSFGGATRQRKYFTKAGYLASRAQPVFTFELGSIRDNLKQLDTPVYQAGVRWRAFDSFDLGGSLYGSDNLNVATLETTGLYDDVRLGFGTNVSDQDDIGISSNIGGTVWDTSYNASIISTVRGGTKPEVFTVDTDHPLDPIFNLDHRNRELEFQDRTSKSLSVYRRIDEIELRLAGESSTGDGAPSQHSVGPYVEWSILDNGVKTFRLQVSDVDTEKGRIFSTGGLYAYRLTPQLILAAQLAHRVQEDGNETVFLTSLNYDGKNKIETGNRAVLDNEIREKKDKNGGSITSVTDQAQVENTNEFLQTTGFVRDTETSDQKSTSYGINAVSSFLVASDGSLSVSHPVTQEGVLVAEVMSHTTNSTFEILLNDQVMGTIESGTKVVLGVAPYRTYEVKIRPVGKADLVSYESAPTKITVFPGNVVKKSWKVEKVFILIGKVVDANGVPLVHQRIKGPREYTVTEDDGTFQAEIAGDEQLTIDNANRHCTLQLRFPGRPEYFLDAGNIVCQDR